MAGEPEGVMSPGASYTVRLQGVQGGRKARGVGCEPSLFRPEAWLEGVTGGSEGGCGGGLGPGEVGEPPRWTRGGGPLTFPGWVLAPGLLRPDLGNVPREKQAGCLGGRPISG